MFTRVGFASVLQHYITDGHNVPWWRSDASTSEFHEGKTTTLLSVTRRTCIFQISSDHANAIRALAEHAMRLNSVLASFHTEFSKFTVVQTRLAQTELMKLSSRIHELDLIMRE